MFSLHIVHGRLYWMSNYSSFLLFNSLLKYLCLLFFRTVHMLHIFQLIVRISMILCLEYNANCMLPKKVRIVLYIFVGYVLRITLEILFWIVLWVWELCRLNNTWVERYIFSAELVYRKICMYFVVMTHAFVHLIFPDI